MKISIKLLEEELNIKIKKGCSLGLDAASKTGWVLIETHKKNLDIKYGFIKVTHPAPLKYIELVKKFNDLIRYKKDLNIIIEDQYVRFLKSAKVLYRISMIPFVISCLRGMKVEFVHANTARSLLGLGMSKKVAQSLLIKKLNIKEKELIDNDDIVDALILALIGIIERNESKK